MKKWTLETLLFTKYWLQDSRTGWRSVHDRIIKYRNDKKLTIKKFLEICGLPSNSSYFQQLSCQSGIDLHPSDKTGTAGNFFLDSVKSFFKSDRCEETEYSLDLNIDHIICDLKYNEFDKFQELGILRVFLREDEIIHVSCLKTADEEAIRAFLEVKLGSFVLEFCKVELLVSSPQSISASHLAHR